MIIDLNTKEIVFARKIIDLDIELSNKKRIITFVFKINNSDIYIAMILIN